MTHENRNSDPCLISAEGLSPKILYCVGPPALKCNVCVTKWDCIWREKNNSSSDDYDISQTVPPPQLRINAMGYFLLSYLKSKVFVFFNCAILLFLTSISCSFFLLKYI